MEEGWGEGGESGLIFSDFRLHVGGGTMMRSVEDDALDGSEDEVEKEEEEERVKDKKPD